MALVESFDNFAGVRNALRHIADERDEWAGIPMPLEGRKLVIEPRFPNADAIASIGQPPEEPSSETIKLRNCFYSHRKRCEVYIWEEEDGRIRHGLVPAFHHLSHDLQTLGASFAWGIEQESKAINYLAELVRHHQFKQYMLTGMFLERSARSGLTYMFRRLKPTVVLDARNKDSQDATRVLCALCLHPIAYYDGSWAGAMCPTDDVIAHLMLMRGDEHMYWKRANQHPPYRPEAGL